MNAYEPNQTNQELALASVQGSYHRRNKQDPFLMAWLSDYEAFETSVNNAARATKKVTSPAYSC